METYKIVREKMRKDGKRFWSNDNISEYITPEIKEDLIREAASAFFLALNTLLIDVDNDPNSQETATRIAKMYLNEIFSGRYDTPPKITGFPNEGEEKYEGMLVVRAEIKSTCAHHHQSVNGICYIGVIPDNTVLGLSKYIRIAQFHARRGTLQEELTTRIAKEIQKIAYTEDVAIYIQASHGCISCRGVEQNNSLTQTCVLHGEFKNPDVKKEFFDNIKLQATRN